MFNDIPLFIIINITILIFIRVEIENETYSDTISIEIFENSIIAN